LRLVAKGLTYKEIGDKMYLSEASIKYHMGEITHRLHLENRSQVIAFATEIGLITGKVEK
jgi:two-component system NarL family response regulator